MTFESDIETFTKGRDVKGGEKVVWVEVCDSFERLQAIQQQWDQLAESVGSEIFLTYDWCRIWWKYYGAGRDLRVYVFRSAEKLVGVLPLFFESIRLGPVFVRAGKIVGSDHTLAQFSPPVRRDHIRAVVQRFYELISRERWDIIHIGPIAGLYSHYEELSEALDESFGGSCILRAKKTQDQTYFLLADKWAAQLKGLSRNARKRISRHYRQLNKALHHEPGRFASEFATVENADEMFRGFVHMHQVHWKACGKLGHFGDWQDAFEFHREMVMAQLKYDRLRLMASYWGTRSLGYEYAYKFGDKYFAFLNARTDSEKLADINVCTSMFTEQVKRAMSENVRCVDDMRGKYDYKLRLGGKLFPVRSIYVLRKKGLVLIRVMMFRILSRLLDVCYYRIWFCTLAPRLPFGRTPLRKIWVKMCAFV
ncbi:MAG: GNAT family N-acetyltransferase [Phycisphaerales bacterium]|nr:MAG: GNAT family N-acetyltransferase [Phycisphaerales bacterium]